MIIPITSISSSLGGFQKIAELHNLINNSVDNQITLDFTNASWVAAHMSSPLGAVLDFHKKNGKEVTLINLQPQILEILSKNQFMTNFGGEKLSDQYYSTIPYCAFSMAMSKDFAEHIDQDLLSHRSFPNFGFEHKRIISRSLSEVFDNSVIHSQSNYGVYSCGQLFPKKKLLDYAITDLGVGFEQNILNKAGIRFSKPQEAIEWALTGANTTKQNTPGGLGLKDIREYIESNRGTLQIISRKAYWLIKNRIIYKGMNQVDFPGTTVHMCFNAQVI